MCPVTLFTYNIKKSKVPLTKMVMLTVRVNKDLQPQQECIPVGCILSAAVAISWVGVPGPRGTWSGGGTWSQGRGYSWSKGGVPGPKGVYLVQGAPGPGGCTWSQGGAPGPGGVPHQIHPPDQVHSPMDRHTLVKT